MRRFECEIKSYLKFKNILIFGLIAVSLLIKIILIRKDLPPFNFSDEEIFSLATFQAYKDSSFVFQEFRSGNFNILPVLISMKIINWLIGYDFTYQNSVLFGRVILILIQGIITNIFLIKIVKTLKNSNSAQITVTALFCFSPFILINSKYWYPDSYIILFVTIFIYIYLLNIKKPSLKNYILIGMIIGIATSIKYTGMALLFSYLLVPSYKIFIVKTFSTKVKFLKEICIILVAFLLTFISINYSIFWNFDKFATDSIFSFTNYGKTNTNIVTILGGLKYYGLFLFGELFSLIALPLIIYCIYFFIKTSSVQMVIFFLGMPTVYIVVFSTKDIVINRNMMFITPFILLMSAIGFSILLEMSSDRFKKLLLLPFLFLVAYNFFNVYKITSYHLKPSSQEIAKDLIIQNYPDTNEFGINQYYCMGTSVVEEAKKTWVEDREMALNLNYYVINSYCGSVFDAYYLNRNGLVDSVNLSDTHFYHFNDRMYFAKSKKGSFTEFENLIPVNYRLVHIISSYGPDIIILQRNS